MRPGRAARGFDESGSVSVELVMLVPVLVLLTLFVLWAGRGGRAGLTADLAAEEAATAAALCCEEGDAYASDREALVADMLASRPGLQFLCIGGLRPTAGAAGAPAEFVQEHWLDFEPAEGVSSGGVGVLGVRFECETDGAVAPLRGLFPTVTFHGQASEVVVRQPPLERIGFESSRFIATEGPGNPQLVFKVTSRKPVPQDVEVEYEVVVASTTATESGSGLGDIDYTPALGTQPIKATMNQGDDELDIAVTLSDDSVYEGTEKLVLKILNLYSPPGNSTPLLPDSTIAQLDPNRLEAEGWIQDDEVQPHLFISPQTPLCEVGEGTTTLSFDVLLRDQANTKEARSAATVTVDADTAVTGTGDGHASAGTDFMAQTGNTVTFNSGDHTKTVTVDILDDTASPVGEPDETFKVELSNPNGAPLGGTTEVTCTILDDEVRVTVIGDVSADEGDDIQFKLMLDRDLTADIRVHYRLVDHNNATHGATRGTSCPGTDDYEELIHTFDIKFPSSRSVDLPTVVKTCEDNVVEYDETFWLEISIPAGGGEAWVDPSDNGAIGTIVNDDIPVVSISPTSDSGTEGTPATPATVDFTVKLDDGSGNALQLMPGNDITVDYEIGGTGTNPATDIGQTGADYSATLDGTTLTASTLSGNLTFSAPTPSQYVFAVQLEPDYLAESTETLQIDIDNLSDPVGAAKFEDRDGDPSTVDTRTYADVTIIDDPPPELSVSNFTGDEGDDRKFTVTLAKRRANETVTVDYNVCGRTGSGATDCTTVGASNTQATVSGVPGLSDHDFIMAGTCATPTGSRSGTFTFSGATTTHDVDVELCRDTINEVDETLRLELSNPSQAVLKDRDPATVGVQAYGEGTIVDEDAPKLYVDNDWAYEGETLTFTVTLCRPRPNEDVTVDYATQARSAVAGGDFTAVSGTLSFPDTMPSQKITAPCGTGLAVDAKQSTVDVVTSSDLITESDEEVHLVLSSQTPSHIALGKAVGVGRIVNVNAATVRVGNPSATEGSPLGFAISLEDDDGNPADITKPVTVHYATFDGTATAGTDYTSASGSVTFAASAGSPRTHTVSVATTADNLDELDETVGLRLRLASDTDNAGLGDAVGTGTIVDTPPPYVRIDSPAAVSEGGDVTFTVGLYDRDGNLTSHTAKKAEVSWATADVTATAGSDYTADSGWLIFDPGDQQKTITVSTLADSTAEQSETFRVDLSVPRNAIIDRAVGIGTIKADLPRLSVSDASARPGDTIVFTVTLDQPSSTDVTVDYWTQDDTAVSGTDYTAVSGTLTIAPGSAAATVSVATDASGAGNKSFKLQLRKPTNAMIDDDFGVGTILQGTQVTLTISDATASEGEDMRFSLESRGNVAASTWVSVFQSTSDGTATANSDYQPFSKSTGWTHLNGAGSASSDVRIIDDSVDEVLETFLVELSNPHNAVIADGIGVGTIEGDLDCVDMRDDSTDTLPTASITGTSADEDDATMDLTVSVTEAMCQNYDFRFEVSADTRVGRNSATLGTDYLQPANVTLIRGQTSVAFSVTLVDDDLVEGDETFSLRAWSRMPGRRALAEVTEYPTIADDDETTLQLSDTNATEGSYLSFVVALDKPSYQAVTFDYATSDGSAPAAAAGADYVATSGSATIAAGLLSVTVAVRTLEDLVYEYDENVALTVSNLSGAQPDPDGSVAVGLIYDNEERAPAASVSDASADEGEKLQFIVTLDEPSGRRLTADWATRDDTAAGGSDYTAASGTVTFAAGETSKTVEVTALTDSVAETTEQMFVDISNSSGEDGPKLGDSIGVGQIRDTTDRNVSVSDAFVTEGGTLAFEVSFTGLASSRDITMKYQTKAGTATAGVDYDNAFESVPQELKIVAGDTSVDVLVATVQDKLDEDGEAFELVLSDPEGAVIADGTASGLIVDDDPLPRLRVGDTSASEADGASATFTVSLSEPSGRDVTAAYATADGAGDDGAVAGDDYTTTAGSLTIDAGTQQATVTVSLVNDDDAENVERFQLQASGVVNAILDDSVGVATVTDDDGSPVILVDDPADVYEAAGASATFRVRLSRAAADEVSVDYATEDAVAKAGDDYTAASGTLTFAAGQTVKTVTVPLVDDDVAESSETFRLRLSSPSGEAVIGDDLATVLILDDDGLPTISVADAAAATEGATATFTATLSQASARPATVAYATRADPTAGDAAATSGVDYTTTSGTLTIPARSTTATATVALLDDSFDEHTETFWLRLSSPTGATIIDGTATGTINDDDPLPRLAIADASADEGSTLSFDVSTDAVSGRAVSVPWTTDALSPGPKSALPGQDYTAASGTVRFAPGTTTATVEVASLADDISESDERFKVQLGTPVNAVLDDAAAVGAIVDDDSEPRMSVADAEVDEDEGPAVFTVTLSRASSRPVTVGYSTADGTATDPDDYAPDLVRTLTIPAGLTLGEISVAIIDDDLAEGTEDFTVTLSGAVNAVIADGAGTATGTILDDEGEPRLTVSDARECEDGSTPADCRVRVCRAEVPLGWTTATRRSACQSILNSLTACQPGKCGDGKIEFPVTLSHASTEDASVRYTTFDGTAASPRDYLPASGTLTIPAGETSAAIEVTLADDGIYEHDLSRTFRLRLDNPVGVELETVEAVGTVNDDEPVPRMPLSRDALDTVANEDDGHAEHTVRLSHPSDQTVTVDYDFPSTTFCGLPSDHDDYAKHSPGIDATPGAVTFAPGVVEQTIRVPLVDNDLTRTGTIQGCEDWINAVYTIRLSNHNNAYPLFDGNSAIDSGVGRVWDDETSPYIESITAPDTLESAADVDFTVTLNRTLDEEVATVFWTADGTATADVDYTSWVRALVKFRPGTRNRIVAVSIIDDSLTEGDETFMLQLRPDSYDRNISHTATQQSGSTEGTVTIIDDEVDLEVSVADARANEDAGTMAFRVSLSRASASDVTVRYATADGTATAGADYTSTSGTLTIDAGDLGGTVSVPITDDSDDTEDDETFTLNLSDATGGATIVDASATGTIVEDSNLPVFTLVDVSNFEGTGDRSRMRARAVSDTIPEEGLARAVELDVRLIEVPSLGEEAATFGDDFAFCYASDECPSQNRQYHVSLPQGWYDPVGLNIDFSVEADNDAERDEKFQFEVINVSGATFTRSQAWGTILNDDLATVTVADVTASEADSAVVFTLKLSARSAADSSLDYMTVVRSSEGEKAATPGSDYTTTTGTLNILARSRQATISVPIIGDTVDEFDETFLLVLSNPKGLKLGDSTAVGTITDDDPGWWIDDRSVWEDAGPMVFTIERDHTSDSAVSVSYSFGSGGSATGGASCADGVDFVWPSGSSTGAVTMPAADRAVSLSVALCDDTVLEGRENLVVELTNQTGRKTTGVGTIVDNSEDKPRPPGTPTGLAATAGDGSVTLTWDDPSNPTITRYEYQVNHNDTDEGNFTGWSSWTPIPGSGATTTSHTITGLTNGKEYRYKLRAVKPGSSSQPAPNFAPWYVTATPTPS